MREKRGDDGRFEQAYGHSAVLAAFEEAAVPLLTSSEVAEAVGCSMRTARRRLDELAAEGELYRKEVGPRAAVYARLDDGRTGGYGEWKRSLWEE